MQSLDLMLFAVFGAGFDPNAGLLRAALLTSSVATYAMVAALATTAVHGRSACIDILLALVCAALTGLLSHALADWLDTARPFAMGLSPDFASHGDRGGLPSTHAAVMASIAAFMAWRPAMRIASVVAMLLALATGWARIYLGVHFPLDVLAGFALGGLCGTAVAALRGWQVRRFLRHEALPQAAG